LSSLNPAVRSSVINYDVLTSALRTRVEFIGVQKMYSKPYINDGDELQDIYPAFTLWKAWVDEKQPPIIIYDDYGTFKPGLNSYSLSRLDLPVDEVLRQLPEKVKKQLQEIQDSYGSVPDDSQAWFILYHNVPALRDKQAARKVAPSWGAFINELVDFKGPAVDPRLRTIRLCHLNGGYDQTVNGHAIICLPGNTMKSTLYEMLGPKDEKISANTTVGYADTEGIHPGSVNGTEHTFTVDQFESQGAWQVFRYLQSLMESGRARVDTAAQPFMVRSSATFIILANPGRSDPSKSFMFLLEHMVKEPSFGRRFGIILYDTKASTAGGKLTRDEERRWRQLVDFYRAVEEAAAPKVKKIYEDQDVWSWLNAKPFSWISHMIELIAALQDEKEEGMRGLHDFLQQFIENGMSHTRGAALSAAISSNLDKILLEQMPKEELLSQAEDFLSQLLDVNESSIRTIAQNYKEERLSSMKAWFDARPAYLKEIIRAVLLLMKSKKESGGELVKVDLADVAGFTPDGQYFSKIVDRAKKANPESHNSELKQRLGFQLIHEGKDLLVAVHSYEVFDIFDIFDIVGKPTGLNERLDSGARPKDGGEGVDQSSQTTSVSPGGEGQIEAGPKGVGAGGQTESPLSRVKDPPQEAHNEAPTVPERQPPNTVRNEGLPLQGTEKQRGAGAPTPPSSDVSDISTGSKADETDLWVCFTCGTGPYKGENDKTYLKHKQLLRHSGLKRYYPPGERHAHLTEESTEKRGVDGWDKLKDNAEQRREP
jgi:hypothetical protein